MSRAGRPASWLFRTPLVAPRRPAGGAFAGGPPGGEGHVVVCDADPVAGAAHAAALAGAGFAVTVCNTVDGCVSAARRVQAVAVVVGLLFPDGDGLQLLRRLGAEVTPRPRLLMVSAVRAGDWAGPAGADAFLPKPVTARRLVGTLRALLREDA